MINIYCDESCHLEHDHQKVMVIGAIKCPTELRKQISRQIIEIQKSFGFSRYSEIKWTKVSPATLECYKRIVDFFFSDESLSFRAIIVDKSQLRHSDFNQTHDEFYYKMYFHCLNGIIDTQEENYIYLDKKDTKGSLRTQKLHEVLCCAEHDFNRERIKRIQCVSSFELPILQLADLFIGAIGYHNRAIQAPGPAKLALIQHIIKTSGYSLEKSTLLSENKFNLFFINLR